ncbi:MAG: isocitrate lyase/PEP mutase family protein [Hyphomicrobiales bacterium]|nr:isocitrate lyase/PEP mutase family protein [Hyphomicrobiales bacterium]
MATLKDLIRGRDLVVAPVALNPLMARMAEEAGFKAVYLSGGSLGWVKCVTEANLALPELASVALDMRAVCKLPIVLDAGGGWGDPVHVHRTVALAEAAGFAAIEIEDQLLPRRMEHHVGIDHLVPNAFFLKKLAEALAARTDPDLLIIARTNAVRVAGIEEAVRRGESYQKAGADMVFCYTRNADELRFAAERLAPPLMMFAPADGFATFPLSRHDLSGLGFRLAASSGTAFAAMYKAIRQSYRCLAENTLDPFLGKGGAEAMLKAAQTSAGFEKLLEIERRTMKE